MHEPTGEESFLDLVIATPELNIENVQTLEPLGTSDHKSVSFTLGGFMRAGETVTL